MARNIILQIGVKAFIANRNGEYLILKRSQLKYPLIRNNWDIPGGRIIPGTTLVENLKREIFEETGLKIFGKPKLIGAQDIIRPREKHIVRLTFIVKAKGRPKLDNESVSFKWLSLKEMLALKELDEYSREVIEKNFLKK